MIGVVRTATAGMAVATALAAVSLSMQTPTGEEVRVAAAGGAVAVAPAPEAAVPSWLAGLLAGGAAVTVWLALRPRLTRADREALEAAERLAALAEARERAENDAFRERGEHASLATHEQPVRQ
jgi:hypothetical protein